MPAFQRVSTSDRNLEKVQDNVGRALSQVFSELDSRTLRGVVLVAGQLNTIDHKLGRKLEDWHLVRLRGNATVWDEQDDNLSPHLHLHLRTSADVTVDIKVS